MDSSLYLITSMEVIRRTLLVLKNQLCGLYERLALFCDHFPISPADGSIVQQQDSLAVPGTHLDLLETHWIKASSSLPPSALLLPLPSSPLSFLPAGLMWSGLGEMGNRGVHTGLFISSE